MNRKQKQVERYLKASKHFKTRDERKEDQRLSQERKAALRQGKPGRDAKDVDDAEDAAVLDRAWRRTAGKKEERKKSARDLTPLETEDAGPPAGSWGLVVSVTSGRARVRLGPEEVEADVSEAIAKTQKTSLAVGDDVLLVDRPAARPRIEAVGPRRSMLSRPDPGRADIERVFAANVDRAVIVVSVRSPAFRPRLIDRYLIAVQHGGVEPIVCANKSDLVEDAGERAKLDGQLEDYRALGIPALFTSAEAGEGVEALREHLAGATAVFVGQSGVGKSSLLNAVSPELGLFTGVVRVGDGKGRHTTTSSSLHEAVLPSGRVRLIDTPGIRGFKLANVDRRSLAAYFPEFDAPLARCRFNDCSHTQEPACGVRAAAECGEIPAARYDTYLRIRETLE